MAIVDLDDGTDRIGATYDVGIIGAGPAGITLGVELARRGLRVLVCEGGARERTEQSQEVYRGENSPNYYPLEAARLRFLGGSTNHWGGNVHFLDESDFAARPPGSTPGWPISRRDIEPFFPAAREWVGLPRDEVPVEEMASRHNFPADIASGGGVRSSILRFSPVKGFGDHYRAVLRETPGLVVALNANLVDLRTTTSGIRALVVANWKGDSTEVAVERTVFACGGIENPRLLLNFADRHKIFSGVAPLAGTHFMEHLCIYYGAVLVGGTSELEGLAPITGDVGSGVDTHQWVGTVDPEARLSNGIDTNVSFTLDRAFVKRTSDLTDTPEGLGVKQLLALAKSGSDAALFITPRAEQLPNPASRVSLIGSTDALGMRRARLDWRYTAQDHTSIVRAVGLLARNLARAGVGRVFMGEDHTDWSNEYGRPIGGFHHMGTTRMSDSPAAGVVDENLRVHGTDNVYVAGSSVFSTAGWANPTINIVAFSLRLADHLVRT